MSPVARSSDTTKMTAAHFNNRWYVVTGQNTNLVVESDASVVTHGLVPPGNGRLTATATNLSSVFKLPSGADGGLVTATVSGSGIAWVDTDAVGAALFSANSPYAVLNLSDPETEGTIQYEFTSTDVITNKALELHYRVANVQYGWGVDNTGDSFNDEKPGWEATLVVEYSIDNGSTWIRYHREVLTQAHKQIQQLSIPLANAVATEDIHFRFNFRLNQDFGRVGIQVYNAEVHNGQGRTIYTNDTGALYYAITEYDSKRGWESNISDYLKIPIGETFRAVHVRLPASPNNDSATHYRVYRTSNVSPEWAPSGLGLVTQLSITTSASAGIQTFSDLFSAKAPSVRPTPNYEMLIQNEFGTNLYFDINDPPPAMTFIGNFGGALFGLNGRSYHQAIAGRPWQWPGIFVIDRMPFKEHSPLVAAYQVGDRLWIGSEAGVITLDSPIEMKNRHLILPTPVRLEGAPGCVGGYAATPLSFAGEGLVAWVSLHGVVISNLATYERITDDIDWESNLTEASLGNAVLFWREKKQQLVLCYDSTGDGSNDSFALIHMAKELRNKQGNPLITWGHPGKFSHWWGGKVGGAWKEWTGKANSDREIYLENDALYSDASNSHDGSGNVPFDVQTGRVYFDKDVAVTRARIYHTAPSTTFTMTVNYDTGRDGGTDRSKEILLGISGTRGRYNDFNVSDAGDFMQWRLRRTGTEKFAVGSIEPFVEGQDEPGDLA